MQNFLAFSYQLSAIFKPRCYQSSFEFHNS